jgi:hypothetical protein
MPRPFPRPVALCALLGVSLSCADSTAPLPGPGPDAPVRSTMATIAAMGGEVEVIYGPETFVRGRGQPVTETGTIEVAPYEAPFTLHVRNGDEMGGNKVLSAQVWVDGELVLGRSAFSAGVASHAVAVSLGETAQLAVRLGGGPESEVTVWIEWTPPPFDALFYTVWAGPTAFAGRGGGSALFG